MEIPFLKWYGAIEKRKSRRRYDPARPVPAETIQRLKEVSQQFLPFEGARVAVLEGDVDEIFTGLIGSYGRTKGAPGALLFIGDMKQQHVQETAGYTGEAVVLEAVSLGLGTCWIAGNFSRHEAVARAGLKAAEKVLAVSPIGFPIARKTSEERLMTGFARSGSRKPLSSLVSGIPQERWAEWVMKALEAARLAPSAVNRQPWHFTVEENSIVVSRPPGGLDFNVSRRLDCGIAMLHLEVGAGYSGVTGEWEFLEGSDVARFKPSLPAVKRVMVERDKTLRSA